MNVDTERIIEVVRMRVQQGRLVCDVWFNNPFFRYTTTAFLLRVLKEYPNLSQHACVNAKGNTFRAVMNNTSLPHLLEHLVIELQVRSEMESFASAADEISKLTSTKGIQAGWSQRSIVSTSTDSSSLANNVSSNSENTSSNTVFVGTSEWICEQEGRARISVSFTDDLVALRAFQEATNFLNETVIRYAHDFSSSDI